MFRGVVVGPNTRFGSILTQKLKSNIFKEVFTIIHCVEVNDCSKWQEIIPQIDIIFFSAGSSEFSEEIVQLINERIKEKKLSLFFFHLISEKNIAKQLKFFEEEIDTKIHFTYGYYFKLNFEDFNKLFLDNYNNLSVIVKGQLNQFLKSFEKEMNVMKDNDYVQIGNDVMNSIPLKDLSQKDDWFVLANDLNKSSATILLHKNLKVCFCHWYFRVKDNDFSESLLKLIFSFVLYDHLNENKIVKYCNNLRGCQKNCRLTDIDITIL